jgi:hypothetical protein
MTESNDKQDKFFGAYVDRDVVLRLSRWSDGLAWVILAIYGLTWLVSLLLFFSQYAAGMMGDKGSSFLMSMNMYSFYFTQPIPGIVYFISLQAVSKVLLVLLDIEDSTRRGARK